MTCADCSARKTPKCYPNAPLLPIPVEGLFDRVAVDCLGPFLATHSNNRYIVIFTDYLTRWPEGFAVSNVEATTIAELFVDHILVRHGAPRAKLILAVCDIIHTKKLNTTHCTSPSM